MIIRIIGFGGKKINIESMGPKIALSVEFRESEHVYQWVQELSVIIS